MTFRAEPIFLHGEPIALVVAWIVAAATTVVIPLMLMVVSRMTHDVAYQEWQYSDQQQAHQEEMQETRPWWDWNWGRASWNKGNGNYAGEEEGAPWWFWGGYGSRDDDSRTPGGTFNAP